MASSSVSGFVGFSDRTILRCDHDQHRRRCSWTGIEMKMTRNRTASASFYPLFLNELNKDDSPKPRNYKEVTKPARKMFAREVSIQSNHSEISIAKVLLYIAAEDEAFLAFNREMDAQSIMRERGSVQDQSDPIETGSEELLQLDGKSISEWLSELDAIYKEVEAELVSRDISCNSIQVLNAVNAVLFGLRGFKMISTTLDLDPKYFYLHSVLNCRCSTAFLLSVIYIEVCQRLGVPIVGSLVGKDFLIWPKTEDLEELFKVTSGQSLFAIVNGLLASDLTGKSLLDLKIVTNRDIIRIALTNLIWVYWCRASKSYPELMPISPLAPLNKSSSFNPPLLRREDLRLAIAAAERLLMLDPRNWRIRRELGMMLYYMREYGEAIQELSICLAFALEEDAKVLKLFIKKLHLLRLISSLKSPLATDRLTVP